jgi:hypothetical protein
MTRKVAILGRAGTLALAPFEDPEWEMWSLPWSTKPPKAHRLFDIHSKAAWATSHSVTSKWEGEAERRYPGVPVYCHKDRVNVFRAGVEYPFEDVIAGLPIPYLESSISYQIALALHEGVDEIGLFGVNMAAHSEYDYQRPSATYLIGLAQGRGVTVTIPQPNRLFESMWPSGRYGLDSRPNRPLTRSAA